MRDWDNLYRDQHPRTRRSQDMLNRHLDRTGSGAASRNDPTAQLQVNMLRQFLELVDAALEDEHVPRDTAIRVIDRLIYGAVPSPVEAAERQRLMQKIADLPLPPLFGPDWKPTDSKDRP